MSHVFCIVPCFELPKHAIQNGYEKNAENSPRALGRPQHKTRSL